MGIEHNTNFPEGVPSLMAERASEIGRSFVVRENTMFDGLMERIGREGLTNFLQKARRIGMFLFATTAALAPASRAQERITLAAKPVFETLSREDSVNRMRQLRQDYESFRRVANDKIYALAWRYQQLKELLGNSMYMDDFLRYSHIREDMLLLRDMSAREKEGGVLDEEMLLLASETYRARWSEQGQKQEDLPDSDPAKQIRFYGFDALRMSDRMLQRLLRVRYPSGLLRSVDAIAYVDDNDDNREKKGESLTMLGRMKFRNSEKDSITIFRNPENDIVLLEETLSGRSRLNIAGAPKYIRETLDHELAHANSWEGAAGLTSPERIIMFHEIAEMYLQGGFSTDYVRKSERRARDLVRQEKSSLAEETSYEHGFGIHFYHVLREYWAELAAAYFQNPKRLMRQHLAEYALVDKWVKRIGADENFKPGN
ncbi:MAG: hypothetical protein A3J67_06430 [Parcubacteria group bacterium RIFCSPHIGHO2_02_FULL_48_10b]|nr:MAG: hypothetical protein A3J67_06430 [Parcubacteria group bacterium RIFCSPHIGHO2_02_FULL_48_10b]